MDFFKNILSTIQAYFTHTAWEDVAVAALILGIIMLLTFLLFYLKNRKLKKATRKAKAALSDKNTAYEKKTAQYNELRTQSEEDKLYLSKEINELQSNVDKVSTQLTATNTENQQQQSQIRDLSGYKKQFEDTQLSLNTANDTTAQLSQSVQKLETQLESRNQEISRYQQVEVEFSNLKKEFKQLQADQSTTQKEATKTQSNLEKIIADKDATIQKIKDDNEKAIAKVIVDRDKSVGKLKEENEKAASKLKGEADKTIQKLTAERDALQQQLDTKNELATTQKATIEKLSIFQTKYQEVMPAMDKLQANYDTLKPQRDSFEGDLNELKAKVEQLENRKTQLTEELSGSHNQNDVLRAEIDALKLSLETTTNHAEVLEQNTAQLDKITGKLKLIQQSNHELSLNLASNEKQQETLQSQVAFLQEKEADFNQLVQDKITLGEEIQKLKNDLAYVEQTKTDLINKFEATQKATTDEARNKEIIGGFRTKFNEATAKNDELQKEITFLKELVADEEAKNNKLKASLDITQAGSDKLNLEISSLQQQTGQPIPTAKSEDNNDQEVATLKATLENTTSENKALCDKVEALEKELQEQKNQLNIANENVEKLEKSKETLNHKIADISNKLNSSQATVKTLNDGLAAAKATTSETKETVDTTALEAEKATLTQKVADLEAALNTAKAEAKTATDETASLEALKAEKTTLTQKVADLEAALNTAKAEAKTAADNKVESTTDTTGFEAEKAILDRKIADISYKFNVSQTTIKELNNKLAAATKRGGNQNLKTDQGSLEGRVTELEKQLENAASDLTKRTNVNSKLNDQVKVLEEDKGKLRGALGKLKNQFLIQRSALEKLRGEIISQNKVNPKTKDEEEAQLAILKAKASQLNFGRIGAAKTEGNDNLQAIKGIGPFFERKLNAMGINSLQQIANLKREDIEKITEITEFFPGRIERDDWVGQATKLLSRKA